MVASTQKILRFGVFELNLDAQELRRFGTLIKLAPQPLRLLALLANHAGQIVTREEIKVQVWGDETYVDFEQGMNHCIKQIRTVLGDNADNPLYVETLPRRGYRFLAPVVSKNILAPPPRIIKSTSGIQSAVQLAPLLDEAPAAPKPAELPANVGLPTSNHVPPETRVADMAESKSSTGVVHLRSEKLTDMNELGPPTGVIHVPSPLALAGEGSPGQGVTVTSAIAAAETPALEIPQLRKSSPQQRQALVWIAAVLAALVASVLYWQLR